MFFLQRWLWWCVEFYIFKGRAGLLQYTQVLFFLKQFHSLCYKIHIHIIYLFIMLQDSWWKSRVDGCKNSPSFASSSSAPSPSHGSSPPEQGTSTKSPQISNTLLIIVYHIYYIFCSIAITRIISSCNEHQQKLLKFRTYCRIISRRQVSLLFNSCQKIIASSPFCFRFASSSSLWQYQGAAWCLQKSRQTLSLVGAMAPSRQPGKEM